MYGGKVPDYSTPVEDIVGRYAGVLRRHGYHTLGDMKHLTIADLRGMRGIGRLRVQRVLFGFGLTGGEMDDPEMMCVDLDALAKRVNPET